MIIKRLINEFKRFRLCGYSLKKYRELKKFEKRSKELYEWAEVQAFCVDRGRK